MGGTETLSGYFGGPVDAAGSAACDPIRAPEGWRAPPSRAGGRADPVDRRHGTQKRLASQRRSRGLGGANRRGLGIPQRNLAWAPGALQRLEGRLPSLQATREDAEQRRSAPVAPQLCGVAGCRSFLPFLWGLWGPLHKRMQKGRSLHTKPLFQTPIRGFGRGGGRVAV